MARPKEVINDALVKKAKEELMKLDNHKVPIRLQAIISCGEHPISLVAAVFKTDRTSIWRWIKSFEKSGVMALYDSPKGHRPPKLDVNQQSEIAKWLQVGETEQGEPIDWTLDKLAHAVERRFNVRVSTTALWRLTQKLDVSTAASRTKKGEG